MEVTYLLGRNYPTAHKVLVVSSEWYRGIESWLITSISFIKVMTFWKFFLQKKKSHFVLFIEASVHLQDRRELNTCSNDTNENALERGGLGASFEPYDGSTSRLRNFVRSFKAYPLWIFWRWTGPGRFGFASYWRAFQKIHYNPNFGFEQGTGYGSVKGNCAA